MENIPQPQSETPQTQPSATPPSAPGSKNPGFAEAIWAFVMSVIALGFVPIVFGLIGVYLGYRARKKGQEKLGTIAMAVAVVCTILGMILGAAVSVYLQGRK